MKKTVTTPVILFSMLFLLSCEKDFLEEARPTDAINTETVFASKAGVEDFITGMLRLMRSENGLAELAGLYSIYYSRSITGDDIIIVFSNSNNFQSEYYYEYSLFPTISISSRGDLAWGLCYEMIKQANFLIHGVENSTALSETDKVQLAAQGKALRAFFYFQLAMEFTATYAENPTAEAPPLYTGIAVESRPMSTLQEMYDLILNDLGFAVTHLTDYRIDKSYINQRVAYGILARVHQVMGNWPEAQAAAVNAYGGNINSVLDAAGYADGFNDMSNIEWIWGSPQTTDQNVGELGVPHAASDPYNGLVTLSYINPYFTEHFSPTDVRNRFEELLVPHPDFPDMLPPTIRWATTKFTYTPDADHPIIRSPEMLLIEAEALYRQGDEAGAHDVLFQLQLNRDPMAVMSANTGSELLEEILLERRKELYEEIGVEWFDAKRLRRGITRAVHPGGGGHDPSGFGGNDSLLPDDVRFYLHIPQAEIEFNPYIDASVNAYRGGVSF